MSWIENFYSRYLLGYPVWSALLLLSVLVLFGVHAPNYKVDASADTLVLEGDKDLEFFRQIAQRYQSEEFLVVAYQPNSDLLADSSLQALGKLVDELKAVQGVSSVTSILDVPLLYSPKVPISDIANGLRNLRDNAVDRRLVAKELVESPIYRQLLSSLDGDTTAIQINLQSDQRYIELLETRERLRLKKNEGESSTQFRRQLAEAEQAFKDYATLATERRQALVAKVRTILDIHRPDAKKIFLGGVPMIASDMVEFVQSDLRIFGSGVLLFMVVLLAIIFRALRWVLLPVLACLSVNIFMLGYLGWVDWRMTVVSSNFVALILIISLAVAIHLVVRYRELEHLNPGASRKQLATKAVSLMFSPCVFTALTTIVAFSSLVISGIRPIIDFGWMMTLGVLAALVFTFLIVPVGMVLMPVPRSNGDNLPPGEREFDENDFVVDAMRDGDEEVFTLKFARLTERFGKTILWVTAALVVFTILGIRQLQVENRFIDYFDEGTEIYQGMELIDAELGGTIPLDVILFPAARGDSVDAGEFTVSDEFAEEDDEFSDEFGGEDFAEEFEDEFDEFDDEFAFAGRQEEFQNQWFTRGGLDRVKQVHDYLDDLSETGKVLSLATVYQVAGDLLGGNVDDIQLSLAYKSLPEPIREILVQPYLNTEYDEARITVRVKETSRTLNRAELLAQVDSYLQDDVGLQPAEFRLTGMLVLYNNMLQSLFKSQILTLGVVFVAITITLALLFRSLYLAVLAVTPNALAALLVLGSMGWAGLPLDMMTITIAAISIGIGVDDTIHYVHRFKREFAQDRNYHATMYRCHGSIGRAMYYTSVTIIFGFSILALSNFNPTIYFGLLTGAAMFSALIGALLLLPRLLIVCKPLGPEAPVVATD